MKLQILNYAPDTEANDLILKEIAGIKSLSISEWGIITADGKEVGRADLARRYFRFPAYGVTQADQITLVEEL